MNVVLITRTLQTRVNTMYFIRDSIDEIQFDQKKPTKGKCCFIFKGKY